MLSVDLHSHSTRPDGLIAPGELAARAAAQGVKTFALTDHDELGGLEEARAQAEARGMRFIDGVEISVSWTHDTLHIVGLNIDPHHAALMEGLRGVRAGREVRAQKIAADLERVGVADALAGARKYARNPELVSRAHFARYLVEQGRASSTDAVFRRYLSQGNPGYVDHQWATLAQALGWITSAGGVAVIAHPGRYKLNQQQREQMLGEFRDLGGTGVEVVTGSHTQAEYATWARYAQRYGLHASAGSDYHGPGESWLELGKLPDLPQGLTAVWTNF
ncbi:MAG: PHP domain-containing protein [Betaproteobacteria bacterium]|nr:PHP domain-containing protein [Betaproteobacteria bacterium]